jgi:hypothetical protein
MERIVYRGLLLGIWLMGCASEVWAQCSQCKSAASATGENGDLTVGKTLNMGVLYLLAFPVLVPIGVILWWKWRTRQMREAGIHV